MSPDPGCQVTRYAGAGCHELKALKGLRWLLYRHSSIRPRKYTRTLKALEKSDRRIYRTWRLKDVFEQFWEYHTPWAALSADICETLDLSEFGAEGE